MSDEWATNDRIDPDWRKRTITLATQHEAPPVAKGMRLGVEFDGKREIYEVDDVKRGPIGWDLSVMLIATQVPNVPAEATS